MSTQATIEEKLQSLEPSHLQVINESHMHNVPKGSESHFKVVIVSSAFEGKGLLQRHRMMNGILSDELDGKIHALSMTCKTPPEWSASKGDVAPSPQCMGGSKK